MPEDDDAARKLAPPTVLVTVRAATRRVGSPEAAAAGDTLAPRALPPRSSRLRNILIGIPVLDQVEITRACLRSLFEHTETARLGLEVAGGEE